MELLEEREVLHKMQEDLIVVRKGRAQWPPVYRRPHSVACSRSFLAEAGPSFRQKLQQMNEPEVLLAELEALKHGAAA